MNKYLIDYAIDNYSNGESSKMFVYILSELVPDFYFALKFWFDVIHFLKLDLAFAN